MIMFLHKSPSRSRASRDTRFCTMETTERLSLPVVEPPPWDPNNKSQPRKKVVVPRCAGRDVFVQDASPGQHPTRLQWGSFAAASGAGASATSKRAAHGNGQLQWQRCWLECGGVVTTGTSEARGLEPTGASITTTLPSLQNENETPLSPGVLPRWKFVPDCR